MAPRAQEYSAPVTEPEAIQVQANGLDFGALAWGAESAPLALMIHGYPDTAWSWRHLGPYLAERGWRAVAPFTRGYAPTDLAPNDTYLIADQAADILALHTALGGDDSAVLIGHDWGAVATWAVTDRDRAVPQLRVHRGPADPRPPKALHEITTLRMASARAA